MNAFTSTSSTISPNDVGDPLPVGVTPTVVPNLYDSSSVSSSAILSTTKNSPIMYTTRQIKEIESKTLYDHVHSMPYVDRKYFISEVVKQCDVPRRHFYNWQDGYSRIPTFAKKIIEAIVGHSMFDSTRDM